MFTHQAIDRCDVQARLEGTCSHSFVDSALQTTPGGIVDFGEDKPSDLRIIRPWDAAADWDAFVRAHACGTVFHTSGMCRAVDESKKHKSLAIAAADQRGNIHALISPVRVDTLSSLTRPLTSRAIMFGEPLCSASSIAATAVAMLLDEHHRTIRHSVLFTEVRSLQTPVRQCPILAQAGYQPQAFLNYVVDLSQDEDILWGKIGKQTRGNIRRSMLRGVAIETGNTAELKRRAYALIRQSHRRAVVPSPGIDLFHAVRRHLGAVLQVRVATYKGQDVAGTISLAWGDRFFAWYGGTSRPHSVHPFACIVWDEIRWAKNQGLRFYDFGGAGEPDLPYGPRDFKSRFHGELIEHGRCRKVHSPNLLALAERGYKSLKSFAGAG